MADPTEYHTHIAIKARQHYLALCFLALALGIAQLWWLQRGFAIDLPQVSTARVPCLSYAPFRRDGADPARVGADITPAQIEEDLKLIQNLTPCIRTYGVGKGLVAVPEIASKLGLRLRLGVWLGRDPLANKAEMETALALTQKYRANIDALIVGNEVLLRQDLSAEALRAHLQDAKTRSAVPVSYADVWEFWRRHASLKNDVDIVTIHVLPYWEDEPVHARAASAHVFETVKAMKKEFSSHPVWLGETGWPAAGRQRAGALPGVVEQTRVLREVILQGAQERVDINLIEAFDQPWKRNLEGGMGGAWGMFRSDGSLRMSFKGPVQEDAHWWRGPLAGLIGALLGGLIGVGVAGKLTSGAVRLREILVSTLGFALLGTLAPAHIDAVSLWSRNSYEWGVAIVATVVVMASVLAQVLELVTSTSRRSHLARALHLGLLITALIWSWYLWIDPRYRGFPIALFYASAALSVCQSFNKISSKSSAPRWWRGLEASLSVALSIALSLFALLIMLHEGISNMQAQIMGILWLLIALGQLWACYPGHPAKSSSTVAGLL